MTVRYQPDQYRPYLVVAVDRPAQARHVADLLCDTAAVLRTRPHDTVVHLVFDTHDDLAAPSATLTVYLNPQPPDPHPPRLQPQPHDTTTGSDA